VGQFAINVSEDEVWIDGALAVDADHDFEGEIDDETN